MSVWKNFLARIFKPGIIPEEARTQLETDGLLHLEEKVLLSVVFRNFRAPGKRYAYRQSGAIGAFGMSEKRIIAYSAYRMIMYLPFDKPQTAEVDFTNRKNKYLSVAFESSDFDAKQSGQIEFRFHLKDISQVLQIIKSQINNK